MANNYYQATGALNLKAITLVISALFGVFDVKEEDEGQACIKQDDNSIAYKNVAAAIATALDVDEDNGSFEESVLQLATKVGKHDEVAVFLGEDTVAAEEDADLDFLFQLAQLMDDGHGLTSFWSEGALTCDQMRLGQFGGNGEFSGKNFTIGSGSSTAVSMGEMVDNALAENDFGLAAAHFVRHFQGKLNGIRDEATRYSVQCLIRESLHCEDPSDANKKFTEILQHRISWALDEGAPDELDECSVEYIEEKIKCGFSRGELCVMSEDQSTEYRGWWSITKS